MSHKYNNTVILSKGGEHGKRMIEWWKKQGVDVGDSTGQAAGFYYGLFNGNFGCFGYLQNVRIIELPEPTIELKEGNQPTHQFEEWHSVFELQSQCRKLEFSELEMLSVLSNRFELKRKSMVQEENCSRNCGHGEEPKQTTKPQDLIGRKVKGFKFEDRTDGIRYDNKMDHFIGKVGVIARNPDVFKSYGVQFKNGCWFYPTSLIHEHLVDEGTNVETSEQNMDTSEQNVDTSKIIDLSNVEGVEMMVSMAGLKWVKKVVVAQCKSNFIDSDGDVWEFAKPIEVKKVTMEDIEKMFGGKVEIVKEVNNE